MTDLSLTVQYKDKKVAGQFLTPVQTRDIPIITYNGNFNKLYTIIMYDPNAVNGNYIHFVNINYTACHESLLSVMKKSIKIIRNMFA